MQEGSLTADVEILTNLLEAAQALGLGLPQAAAKQRASERCGRTSASSDASSVATTGGEPMRNPLADRSNADSAASGGARASAGSDAGPSKARPQRATRTTKPMLAGHISDDD